MVPFLVRWFQPLQTRYHILLASIPLLHELVPDLIYLIIVALSTKRAQHNISLVSCRIADLHHG